MKTQTPKLTPIKVGMWLHYHDDSAFYEGECIHILENKYVVLSERGHSVGVTIHKIEDVTIAACPPEPGGVEPTTATEPPTPPDDALPEQTNPYDQDCDTNWKTVKDAFQGYPMIAPLFDDLEKIAGNTPVHLWFAAALFEFVRFNDDGNRQASLIQMLSRHANQKCKVDQ
jgi:hypothetical protein